MKSLVVPLTHCARSCALSPKGDMAVAGFDDGSLKVNSSTSIIASKYVLERFVRV